MKRRVLTALPIIFLVVIGMTPVLTSSPVKSLTQMEQSPLTQSVPNPIIRFDVNGESESGDFIKASHLGGSVHVRTQDIDLLPWKSLYWETHGAWVILFANITRDNFMIIFLYLFNGSRNFYYRRFDYQTGTLEKIMLWGKQIVYNETVFTPSFPIPKPSIPTMLSISSPYSVISETTYITGSRGLVREDGRQLRLIPIFQQGLDPKELWTLSTDDQGYYRFTIYYFFESDRSHFTRGHNIRLNDLQQMPIEAMECYLTTGSFPSTLAVSLPIPSASVDVDDFLFKTDERGTVEIGLPGGAHTVAVPDMIQRSEGTRIRFSRWRHEEFGNPGTVMLSHFLQLSAEYTTQHYLKVNSEFGLTTQSAWHDEGTAIAIAVDPVVDHGNATRHVFVGWTGDVESDQPNLSITIDKPKELKAVWKKQYLFSISWKGLPDGASAEIAINATRFVQKAPSPRSVWVDSGSSVDFTVVTSNVTFLSRSYVFERWTDLDGVAVETPARANGPISIIAQFRPSVRASIELIAQPSLLGDSVSLHGRVTPPPSKATVELWYSRDQSSWHQLAEVSASEDGMFARTWRPPERGTIFFRASWEGDEEYAGSESPAIAVTLPTEVSWENLVTLRGILEQAQSLESRYPSLKIPLLPFRETIVLSIAVCESIPLPPWIRDVMAYMLASGIIGIVYLTAPFLIAIVAAKRAGKRISWTRLKPLMFQLATGVSLVAVSQLAGTRVLTMVGLVVLAVGSFIIWPTAAALTIVQLFSPRSSE